MQKPGCDEPGHFYLCFYYSCPGEIVGQVCLRPYFSKHHTGLGSSLGYRLP